MKKQCIILRKIAFTTSIIVFLLVGCKKSNPEKNPEPEPDPNPTEEQTEPREVVRLKSFGEVDGAAVNYSYNSAGFLTKTEIDHTEGIVSYSISSSYIYDTENKITKAVYLESITDADGTIHGKKEEETVYHYDNEGKVTKIDYPVEGDIIDEHIEVVYNDDDQIIELIKRDIRTVAGSDETKTREVRVAYEYNASGDRIKSSPGLMTYTYDSKGNVIEAIPDDSGTAHYYYTYDNNESLHYVVLNSMGVMDRISMMFASTPVGLQMPPGLSGGVYLNYYNPNNVLTYKQTINGVVHWNNTYKYAYNDDGYPIAIEYIKRSPTMPSLNATHHYTLTYETIMVEE